MSVKTVKIINWQGVENYIKRRPSSRDRLYGWRGNLEREQFASIDEVYNFFQSAEENGAERIAFMLGTKVLICKHFDHGQDLFLIVCRLDSKMAYRIYRAAGQNRQCDL